MAKGLLIIFSILLFGAVNGQEVNSPAYDTLYTLLELKDTVVVKQAKKMPVYRIDSCVYPILDGIIDRDVDCNYFIKGKSGYSFSISNVGNDSYKIIIYPLYLDKIIYPRSVGIFDYKNRRFLCNGIILETLLHKVSSDSVQINYYLQKEKDISFNLFGDTDGKIMGMESKGVKLYFLIKACNFPISHKQKNKKGFNKK